MSSNSLADIPGLAQVVIGYMPMIDRQRTVTAVRLTISPLRLDVLTDAAGLLEALAEFWPAEAGRLLVNIPNETLLAQALQQQPALNLMLEVPAFMAADPAQLDALAALHARGNSILVQGRPSSPLPRPALDCLAYSIIDVAEDRRQGAPPPGGQVRSVPHVQSGVQGPRELVDAFARGAIAVLGWPFGDPPAARPGKSARAQELHSIIELMNRVDRHEPLDRLEAVLKNDPTLAFRLMRYINSPAFGLRVEVASFRHAIMLLGHDRLKRWLALLLVSGSRDLDMKPLVFGAVRRGLMLDELSVGNADDAQRGELFICGVFSLLDRMLQQPFAELLRTIPVADTVREALVDGTGPHAPYLALVRAIESGAAVDIREAADALMLAPLEVNRALLRALLAARQLD